MQGSHSIAIGGLLATTKSFLESLNLLVFQKIRVVVGNWDKPGSFNEHERNFNTFFCI